MFIKTKMRDNLVLTRRFFSLNDGPGLGKNMIKRAFSGIAEERRNWCGISKEEFFSNYPEYFNCASSLTRQIYLHILVRKGSRVWTNAFVAALFKKLEAISVAAGREITHQLMPTLE